MSLLLKILQGIDARPLPAFVQVEIIEELFRATAQAFEQPLPALDHLSYDEYLRAYALFTLEQAEAALQAGGQAANIKSKLYQGAYPLGSRLRTWLGLASRPAADTIEEVMELGEILYGAIGVNMQGDARGEVVVNSCYFSRFYSGPVCDLISALDDGVFSGLSGGGRLAFCERITEGGERCRAKLILKERR